MDIMRRFTEPKNIKVGSRLPVRSCCTKEIELFICFVGLFHLLIWVEALFKVGKVPSVIQSTSVLVVCVIL
jgi:hypothetical protein